MGKKSVAWTDQAKADLRAIDQTTALRILHAIARYLASGEGDVKRLQDVKLSSRPSCASASATTASASTTSATRSASWPSSIAPKPTAEHAPAWPRTRAGHGSNRCRTTSDRGARARRAA
jgi:hypothetical protein